MSRAGWEVNLRYPSGISVGYDDHWVTTSNRLADATFQELWAVFLGWRVAILDWPLSPRAVFQAIEPVGDLESLQFLTDERYRVIDRLLTMPDIALRDAFSTQYREFIDALNGGHTDVDWWEGQITPWLQTFLGYAVDAVPPNYRRNQMLLFPKAGLEPAMTMSLSAPSLRGQLPTNLSNS